MRLCTRQAQRGVIRAVSQGMLLHRGRTARARPAAASPARACSCAARAAHVRLRLSTASACARRTQQQHAVPLPAPSVHSDPPCVRPGLDPNPISYRRPKPYHVCSAPAGAREGDDGQRAQRLHAQLLPAQRAREEHAPADALWRAAVLRDVVGPREEADACACIRGFLASRQPRPDDRRGLPSQTRAHATSTRTSDGAESLRQIRSKASVCWPPWRCTSSMCKSPGQRASLS